MSINFNKLLKESNKMTKEEKEAVSKAIEVIVDSKLWPALEKDLAIIKYFNYGIRADDKPITNIKREVTKKYKIRAAIKMLIMTNMNNSRFTKVMVTVRIYGMPE